MSLFSRISHVNLYSAKSEEMVHFYRDVLGMTPLANQDEHDDWYGFAAGDGLQFAIEPLSNRANHASFEYREENPILLQFGANDRSHFTAMTAHLKEHNVPIVRDTVEKDYGLVTNFLDPDGNLLEILLPKDE